eukprot:COSAG01_NODE_54_length_31327_cov_317.045356_13_plen_167_part_00
MGRDQSASMLFLVRLQFCTFEDVGRYADDQPNRKFCTHRYNTIGRYEPYDTASAIDDLTSKIPIRYVSALCEKLSNPATTTSAHGFSTGTARPGNVQLQLRCDAQLNWRCACVPVHGCLWSRYTSTTRLGAASVWTATSSQQEFMSFAPTGNCVCQETWSVRRCMP